MKIVSISFIVICLWINECKVTHIIYNIAYLNFGKDNQFVGMSPRITVCLLSVPSITDKSTNEVSHWCLTCLFYDAFAFIIMLSLVIEHTFFAGVGVTINAEVAAGVVHSDVLAYHESALFSSILVSMWR